MAIIIPFDFHCLTIGNNVGIYDGTKGNGVSLMYTIRVNKRRNPKHNERNISKVKASSLFLDRASYHSD